MIALVALAFAAACGGGDGGTTAPTTDTGGAHGTVVNESSANAAVANVSLTMTKGSSVRTATSSSAGEFTFSNLQTGAWTLTMTVPAGLQLGTGESGTRNVTISANQTAEIPALKLKAITNGGGGGGGATTGSITGNVTAAGTGVPGAVITLAGAGTTATTNAQGAYTLSSVAAGNHTVSITVPQGFALASGESQSKSTTVTAGQTSTVNWLLTAGGGGNVVDVQMKNTAFSPTTVTISAGQSVRWTNVDPIPHTATADNGSFDTGTLNQNQSSTKVFNTAGTFTYHCNFHSNMQATVVVQ